MWWLVAWSIFIGLILLWLLAKSMWLDWRQPGAMPMPGRYQAARAWLEANGYHVVRTRQRSEWVGYYDKREFRKSVIVDFIVRQGAKYYAVKVVHSRDNREENMSGLKLRDQWYPIVVAFRVHGVLHLDLDGEQVHLVDFELKAPAFVRWQVIFNRSMWLLTGVLITFAWLHRA
ncbi:MAG: hypothetical protein K6T83_14945 [Alicyclobacillus sp.]|nr:hypothetical protein [Alicyclobacillus sp.]